MHRTRRVFFRIRKIAPKGDFLKVDLLAAFLALLIRNTAARLASRLAGRLALAASALLRALAKIARLHRLDMLVLFHKNLLSLSVTSS